MKTKLILLTIFAQVFFCQFTFAQIRGVEIKVKKANGQTADVQLYAGSYALIIGNSEYANGWERLSGVKADVAAVQNILERHGFQVETEENLTSERFEARIRRFINDYGFDRDNRLIIYYAGHGYTLNSAGDKRELGYIIPSDTPLPTKDERGFRQKAVSMISIQSFARQIQAKHALFIFDSCFSGKLFALRNTLKITPFIFEKVDNPVRQFITAGNETQAVPDESVFRKSFVRGLEGEADRNDDAFITGTELADYLKEKVTNYSERRQTPQYGLINDIDLDKGDFVFIKPSNKLTPAQTAWNNFRSIAKNLMQYNFRSLSEELIYDDFNNSTQDLLKTQLNDKWGFIDRTGREVIPFKYDAIGTFSDGLVKAKIGEKWGFIDKRGTEIIPFKFDEVSSFSEGLAKAKLNQEWGFINKTGQEVIPFMFGEAGSFSDGLAPVNLVGDWGFIDKRGKPVIPYKYEFAYSFSNGLAMVGLKNNIGFIDKTGREVIPVKFEIAEPFSDGFALVRSNYKWKFINKTGVGLSLNFDIPDDSIPSSFSEGLAKIKLDDQEVFIDKSGRKVMSFKCDYANAFSDGLAQVTTNNKIGFINKTGREIIPIKYDDIWCKSFIKEGFIGVELNGKKGFVDFYGNEYFDF